VGASANIRPLAASQASTLPDWSRLSIRLPSGLKTTLLTGAV
jgi:hypothetical protein